MRPLRHVALLLAVVVAAGCGSTAADPDRPAAPTSDRSTASPGGPPAAPGEVTGLAMVLEEGSGGPRLCLGGVLTSSPPQCDGPRVERLSWADVPHDEQSGVRWADSVRVTGTWDGATMTLTRTPQPASYDEVSAPSLATICPEPRGGWRVVDETKVGPADLDAVSGLLDEEPDVVRAYVTYFGDVGRRLETDPDGVDQDLVPTEPWTIYNVVVTTDPAAWEAKVREVWGGALCVVEGPGRTERERRRIADEVSRPGAVPGLLSTSPGDDAVEVLVIYDDGSIQRDLDRRHGVGTVVVASALRPATSDGPGGSDPTT